MGLKNLNFHQFKILSAPKVTIMRFLTYMKVCGALVEMFLHLLPPLNQFVLTTVYFYPKQHLLYL